MLNSKIMNSKKMKSEKMKSKNTKSKKQQTKKQHVLCAGITFIGSGARFYVQRWYPEPVGSYLKPNHV